MGTGIRMSKWAVIGITALGLGIVLMTPTWAEEKLTIVSWGGAFQEAQRKVYFDPYTKETGVTIVEDKWGGEVGKVRAMVESGNVTWDLIIGELAHVIAGCEEGFLEPIDKSGFGDLDDFLPGLLHECGIGANVFSMIYAYDADNIPESWGDERPTTIADLYDTKKFPGRRGIRKNPFGPFEQALMADGVPPEKVFEVLDSPDGIDRVLAKIDTIKKDIIFYTSNAQAPQLLADGEVVMVEVANGRIYNAQVQENKNFVIVWDGQVYYPDMWFIPKGAKKDAAIRFLHWLLQPKVLARINEYYPYAPSRKSALQYVPEKIKPHLSTAARELSPVFVSRPGMVGRSRRRG